MNDHIGAEDLAAYVDGELGAERKSDLESHFAGCPECLDELVEIAAIRCAREKIPAHLLTHALADTGKTARPVLHLRLLFEVAAVFVVVVFVGYLFLSGDRFWQTPAANTAARPVGHDVSRVGAAAARKERETVSPSAQRHDPAAAVKAKRQVEASDSFAGIAVAPVVEKKETLAADKGSPTVKNDSLQASAQKSRYADGLEEQPRPAAAAEILPEKEPQRSTTAAVDGVAMDFRAKAQPPANVMETQPAEAQQSPEKKKRAGAGTAHAEEGKLKDEEFRLGRSVAVPKKAAAGSPPSPALTIEGDAAWSDLRNPELVQAWSWLKKGLVLELEIDGAGMVSAVGLLGNFDRPLAERAASEARKLLFSISEKKSRRVRLSANE